jgi:hypothetical protein
VIPDEIWLPNLSNWSIEELEELKEYVDEQLEEKRKEKVI